MQPEPLDPKNDVTFKLLFAHPNNRDILASLLTAVLRPPSPITEVTVLNPEIDRREAVHPCCPGAGDRLREIRGSCKLVTL